MVWPLGGMWQHISNKKRKKSLTPGTPFEAGSPDPKSDALPPELQKRGDFWPKIIFSDL